MKAKTFLRAILWTAFGFYVCVVFSILFLGGRNGMTYEESFLDYLQHAVNPIPFKTILGYVTAVIEQRWMVRLAVRNVFGNFILFYPMGIFLPCLFRNMRRLRQMALISFFAILSVEVVQLLLRLGIFDIDDVILNIAGWILGYLTLSIPIIRKAMIKMYFLEV
jgi:glycopeptide antibiotics resistance protein